MVLLYDNLTRSHSICPVIGRVDRHRPCVAVRVEDNLCGGQGRHGAWQGGDVAALLDTGGVAAVYCLCGGYCTHPGYYWIDQGARWSFCHSIVRICWNANKKFNTSKITKPCVMCTIILVAFFILTYRQTNNVSHVLDANCYRESSHKK